MRWITERMDSGGVLHPSKSVNDSAQTVLDVLQEKHPNPSLSGTDAFMACDTLPPSLMWI